eukprot:3577587-Rhodomonas_salina.1
MKSQCDQSALKGAAKSQLEEFMSESVVSDGTVNNGDDAANNGGGTLCITAVCVRGRRLRAEAAKRKLASWADPAGPPTLFGPCSLQLRP